MGVRNAMLKAVRGRGRGGGSRWRGRKEEIGNWKLEIGNCRLGIEPGSE
jgi:hypothetical protein